MEQNSVRQLLIDLHNNKGITYTFMARSLDISYNYIRMFIKGERNVSLSLLDRIQRIYGKYQNGGK